jgi:dTDP-4-amino-4,6-dideoxygalactose transaminase
MTSQDRLPPRNLSAMPEPGGIGATGMVRTASFAQQDSIPFNRPFMVGTELDHLRQAHANLQLAGDGAFTALCSRWLERQLGCHVALLTHSCTAALEMAALLLDIGPGDEIVMPSYTFVSTANAFVLRGGVPVFVDIRPDTLNVDERCIEAAITPRTKAIVVVHYAGVGCEMDAIMAIAERHGLRVIEDAAQGMMSTYVDKPLGSIGHLGTLSFHETKNIHSGEGGALLVNDPELAERARLIREKGTNRTHFLEGLVDRYTWVDIGSSYLPGEMTAAFLWGQMTAAEWITAERIKLWARYHDAFEGLESEGRLRRPVVPANCHGNAHMYYVLLPEDVSRRGFLDALARRDVNAVSHYVPLHDSPAGLRFGRAHGSLSQTSALSERLVRLPMWLGLEHQQARVIGAVRAVLT